MIANLIAGHWCQPHTPALPVYNPATEEVLDEVPLSGLTEVTQAVAAAAEAYVTWSQTPVMERTRLMFRYKALLEEHFEELAAIVTRHHGKTLDEARGEVRRGIEVVDFACGAPTLLQGRTLRQVSGGVDQDLYRYPLGVVVGIPPFNFPVMIPLWMMPLAVVAGNTFVLKPSERTPLGAVRLAELFQEAGFPPGVLNVVHGAREIYQEAARHGKRVQALGGAKNHIIVMPDADLTMTIPALLGSAFGNAGERCLAGSVAVAVGDAARMLLDPLCEQTRKLVVGPGDQAGVDVGPLIRAEHRDRVAHYVDQGVAEGATLLVDGRTHMQRKGFFLGPTILNDVNPSMTVGREELFGPVLSVAHVQTLEEAIAQANRMALGNMAVIFTRDGRAAREFRDGVEAGMVGVNVPVAQPFAFFPFSGWKGSFYGDLHVHGTDGIEFYTRKKMFITRW